MGLWREIALPHRDVREGALDESVFAASLSDVVAGRAKWEYATAEAFFQKTFLTHGLKELLTTVTQRLLGQPNAEPVIQLQTPFGGGKTHALVALYHWVKSAGSASDVLAEVTKIVGGRLPQGTRVVTFDGVAEDALRHTPWWHLAQQLGREELVATHDKERTAPGKNVLCDVIGQEPTLILMDELGEFAVKAQSYYAQFTAFCQELTEAVRVLPQCSLVVTLPSRAPYGEKGERALGDLQKIFGRVQAIYTPVEGEEIYGVIRRRLFESVDEARISGEIAAWRDLYRECGQKLPQEVRDEAIYPERMMKAYPFHPLLIDILVERWSTFPDFQRTRGALRLLANIVADLWQRQDGSSLILPAQINFENPQVRRELLNHIDNRYDSVVESDIAGPNAKAKRVDRELGSELLPYQLGTGVATAIFYGSFSAATEKQGMRESEIYLATLRPPAVKPQLIGHVLHNLEKQLWYLHVEGDRYRFEIEPNLNRMIVEKEQAVRSEDVADELKRRLEKLAGKAKWEVYVAPRGAEDIPDSRELKVAVLGHDYPAGSGPVPEATLKLARELLFSAGKQGFRTRRNTLFLLAADPTAVEKLRQITRAWLAVELVKKHNEHQLSEKNRKDLKDKWEAENQRLDEAIQSAWRYLGRPKAGVADEIEWENIGQQTVGTWEGFDARVRKYLQDKQLLSEKISPDNLRRRAMGDAAEKSVEELCNVFLNTPGMPILERTGEAIKAAIVEGIQKKKFGLRVGERIYFEERVGLDDISDEAVVLTAERAKELLSQQVAEAGAEAILTPEAPTAPPAETARPERNPLTGGTGDQAPTAPQRRIKRFRLRVAIPFGRLGDFTSGVIKPLSSAIKHLEIAVECESAEGIDESVLNLQVRETLNQIGAKVIEQEIDPS